jgi:hypothetical protein
MRAREAPCKRSLRRSMKVHMGEGCQRSHVRAEAACRAACCHSMQTGCCGHGSLSTLASGCVALESHPSSGDAPVRQQVH